MKLNTYLIILVLKIIFINLSVIAEPMVVLEYSNNNNINEFDSSDHNNENFSTHHKIKKNETLSNIIQKYYGNKKDLILHLFRLQFSTKIKAPLFALIQTLCMRKKDYICHLSEKFKTLSIVKKENLSRVQKVNSLTKKFYFFEIK